MSLISPRQQLDALGIKPRKALGQNFCTDPALIDAVLAHLEPGPIGPFAMRESDRPAAQSADPMAWHRSPQVWEIGPGLGALTSALADRYPEVTAFEIDERFREPLAALQRRHPGLTIVWGDALKVPLPARDPARPLLICGNLPYYCGTALVQHFLQLSDAPGAHDERQCPVAARMAARNASFAKCNGTDRLVFVLQAEVVRKIAARAGDRDHGWLSVAVQLLARPFVGPQFAGTAFHPQPEVQSALLVLVPHPHGDQGAEVLRRRARQLASCAFRQPRKKAVTLLRHGWPAAAPSWSERFARLSIEPNARAEQIPVDTWLQLASLDLAAESQP